MYIPVHTLACGHTHTPGPDKHTHHTTTFVMSRPWKQGWPSGEQQVHGLVVSIPRCIDVTSYALLWEGGACLL